MIQSLCEVAIFLFQSNQKYVFQYTMKIDSHGKNDLHTSPIYDKGQTRSAKALALHNGFARGDSHFITKNAYLKGVADFDLMLAT